MCQSHVNALVQKAVRSKIAGIAGCENFQYHGITLPPTNDGKSKKNILWSLDKS